MYFTYTLFDHFKEEVFYVGLTEDISRRYMQHLRGDIDSNGAKSAKIQQMISQGITPVMVVIATAETREEGLHNESFAIEFYRALGQPVTNQHLSIVPFTEDEKGILKTIAEWRYGKGMSRIKRWLYKRLGYTAYTSSIVIYNKRLKLEEKIAVTRPL